MLGLFDLHSDLPREGPGSDASTERAFRLIPHLPNDAALIDIGCGPGAQTVVLAGLLDGTILAVDLHQPFLDELERRALAAGCADRISTMRVSMDALPFAPETFDVIWAEGSIYLMGFERGFRELRPLLCSGGYIVASELTWLVDRPPRRVKRFWDDAYPQMTTIAENLAAIERCGFTNVAHFVLPNEDWFASYYDPLQRRIDMFRERYRDDATTLAFLAEQQTEIDMAREFLGTFGYVFYIAKTNG